MDAKGQVPRFDAAVAGLADRQHGVVARRQLIALGFTRTVVERRVRRELLVSLHRGVYAVGHRRLSRQGFWMAAVLAAGAEAVLSHRDAAALHGLRQPHDRGAVDVTTTAASRSTRAVKVHQTTALTPLDVTTRHGIPVTSVTRTLVDLAGVVTAQQLTAALSEAERHRVLDVYALQDALDRTRGRRGDGHARMRAALERHASQGAQFTRSELERMLLAIVEAHDLPQPKTNAIVRGAEVDAYWPQRDVIAELDGWEFHRTREAFEADKAKRNALRAVGYQVLEYTHRQLRDDAGKVAAELRALLGDG